MQVWAVLTGECCIAMRSMIASIPQQFETFLFHRGEETGSIRGWMKVRVPKDRCSTRERLYGKGGCTLALSCLPVLPSWTPTGGRGRWVPGGERPDFGAFAEWISFEEEDAEPAADAPTCPKAPLQHLRYPSWAQPHHEPRLWGDAEPSPTVLCRSRPHSLPEPATGYTNPAYFIFEGVPSTRVLASGTGEARDKQAESQARGQQFQSTLGVWVPLPSEEAQWNSQLHCVPGDPSHGCPLSTLSVGQKKRPKSAILARDTVGLGGRLLTALHMATCQSQLDQVSPGRGGDGQKTLLHQTRSALEPPPRPCREVLRCTTDVRQQGHSGEVPLRSPRGSGAQLRGLGCSGRGEDLLLATRPPADVRSYHHGGALTEGATTVEAARYGGRRRSDNVPCSHRMRM